VSAWWRGHFDETWLRLHRDLFGEERSRQEVSALRELLGLPAGASVLDAPCGWGRHAALLEAGGYRTFGADLSRPLLGHAVAASRRLGVPARYACADLRALPFASASFDAVVDVFTSVGLFDDDEQERAALQELARVTRSGGVLILETTHRDDIARNFAPRDRWRATDGTRVQVRRRFDPVSGAARERWRWRGPEGDEGRSEHRLRVYTAGEVVRLIEAAGFVHLDLFGDWDGRPFAHDSPRLIVRAERI
jgi:SAM-dependent methyltransferase